MGMLGAPQGKEGGPRKGRDLAFSGGFEGHNKIEMPANALLTAPIPGLSFIEQLLRLR